ncbi:MAG TPA: hypothetical protein VEX17_01905 [Bacillales bacterium]|nr:hypothetical protein [Bacillales bacterium]
MDTSVGMSQRGSLGYNLLSIIVDRYRKQAISYFIFVVITIMIKNGNTIQGYRMVLIEMAA